MEINIADVAFLLVMAVMGTICVTTLLKEIDKTKGNNN